MKIIAVEEHFRDPAVASDPTPGLSGAPFAQALTDLGEGRLAAMDAGGVSMQVLSCMGAQEVPADIAPELVRAANDRAAVAVHAHPDRFAAFAALPTSVPEAAAAELDRCISDLGFVGTMIMGRTEGEFLDEPRFEPILAKAAALNVPVYLHPGLPPRAVIDANYAGSLSPQVTAMLQSGAWGWHQETAAHFLHLVHSGVFDRHPDLQVILGHWGEMIPSFLDRIDEKLPKSITKLERSFLDYFRENVYITPSGMFTQAQLRYCLQTISIDRLLFSVDYPFYGNEGAEGFLSQADMPEEHKHQFAHGNAERLLGL